MTEEPRFTISQFGDEVRRVLGVAAHPLPVAEAYDWCVQPNCGAVVLFMAKAKRLGGEGGKCGADAQLWRVTAWAGGSGLA
jgi:hypothetical protein